MVQGGACGGERNASNVRTPAAQTTKMNQVKTIVFVTTGSVKWSMKSGELVREGLF